MDSEHSRELAEHGVRIEGAEENIKHLWKEKVSIDRYVWVERVVVAGCGAVLLWVLQGVLTR